MELLQFLEKHTIVSIGQLAVNKCIIVEVIVDNPKQLIKTIIENNCYVSEIRWWERARISTKSKIGYGGTVDPRDPQNYFFAETDIFQTFHSQTTLNEYIEYLNSIKSKYSIYNLYPAFDIYHK